MPVWPIRMPSGMRDHCGDQPPRPRCRPRCCSSRSMMPAGARPVGRVQQVAEEIHAVRRPRPTAASRLDQQDQHVRDQRQQQAEHQTDDDRRQERAVQTPVEQLPERTAADQAADAHQRDVGDGDHPQSGEDHRHRQRQLDPEQPSEPAVPDRRGRLLDRVRHGPQPVDHAADQQRDRIDRQRDRDVDRVQDRGLRGSPASRRTAPATGSSRSRRTRPAGRWRLARYGRPDSPAGSR